MDNESAGTEHNGHQRSARERQRQGPMWGCMGRLLILIGVGVLLFLIVTGIGWWFVGTPFFGDLVRNKVQQTLAARLDRNVSIGQVEIVTARPQRIVLNDVRISNAPGGVTPYFATVKQIVITGGIDSFWSRSIRVGRIDLIEPHINFEIFPAGAKLQHNFPHWQSPPPGKYQIYNLNLSRMYVRGGTFDMLDRRHNVTMVATSLASDITVTSNENVYAGTAVSPLVHMRIQDYVPFDLDLRGGFRYTPNVLALQSIAMRGKGMEVFFSGRVAPLADAVYNLRLTSRVEAERIRQIFKVQRTMSGVVAMDAMLHGKGGDFRLTGGWLSPRLRADVYELTNARGKLDVTGDRALVDIARASYGGGTLNAHYALPGYSEPYPMSVDLRYNGVSIEKLLEDWTVHDTGLRGGATGRLMYHWNKDEILAGAGQGNATLARSTMAFSNAKYPIPVGGSTDFALDKGIVTFRRADLDTGLTKIALEGKLRIDDLRTDFRMRIDSTDFSELDRIGYNFAHSAGKKSYTLLGLGGAGQITGSFAGPIKSPQVVAHIASTATKYNNSLLGDADIDLKYDGVKSVLTFERANFREGNGRLALTGTVTLPDRGPSPLFDLAVDAANYPLDRAMATVDLKMKANGLGTGKLVISGSPDEGTVRFANLLVRKGTSELRLNGDTSWKPGKGNVDFNLDIAATKFPVADIVAFLDLGAVPVSGELTGTLLLQGPKNKLGGAGAITVENGTIYGEPVTKATANIAFTSGTLKATNLNIVATAGTVTGEAELNLNTNQFQYTIQSSSIDLSKIKALSSLASLPGGNLTLTSSGGGTFEQPQIVLDAKLNEATLRGLSLPPGTPPPSIHFEIGGGKLAIRGSIGDVVTVTGDGTVGTDMTVAGNVQIVVKDVAKLLSYFPQTASFPASGAMTVDLRLGGKMSSLEAVRVDATVPLFNLNVSGHEFTPAAPLAFGLRNGRLVFDSFTLQHVNSTLGITGYAELTAGKRIAIDLKGTLEAALLQLFMRDTRASGDIVISGGIHGTLAEPHLAGTAEFQDAQFRFAGFPQVFDHITGTLIFRPDRIDIDALHATVGGGTIITGGTVAVAGLTPKNIRLSVQGTDVALRYFEGVTVEGDFTLLLNGDLERMMLSGDVDVHRALYFKNFDFTQSLLNVVLSRRSVVPIVAANWQDRVGLRIHLKAPDTLAVKNNLADVTATAELDLTGTVSNPVILGTVSLDEGGRVRINNVDYQVVRGSITFQNPFRIDPYFDLTIEGRVNGGFSEVESGPIDVTINVTGTLDRISPTITSDPPTSDITLFSLLGFGGLENRTGTAASTAPLGAATAGRGLLLQSLTGYFGSRILPFGGAFTYDPGFLDTSSDPGQKVTFEKRVSNNVRLLVVYNLESHKRRELIEWQATPEWTLQFTRDEVRSEYRLEGRFRRRYLGHWTFGGLGANPAALFARAPIEPPAGIVEDREAAKAKAAEIANAPPPPANSPRIVQISYRADARFDTSVLARYVTLKAGQPLSIRETQSSIRSLFATGDFQDIRVESAPANGGVALTFVLSLNYRVGTIAFDGIRGSDRDHATRELTIHIGDVVSLNAVDHSATAIEDYLHRNGFLEATVDPETNFVRDRSFANVIFHVTTGPLAKVGSVTFEGTLAPFTPATLVGAMHEKPGKTYKVPDARSDVDNIRRFIVRQEYRKAMVQYVSATYDKPSHSVALRYHVDTGPIVKIEVVGVPPRAVRGELPFRKNQPYSEDVIDRAADAIVTSYQEHGYFNATVDTDGKLVGNTWITTFHVNPGQHYQLTAVSFSGNASVPAKELAGVITTSVSGGFRSFFTTLFRRPTGVTRTQLGNDRDAIESYYRLHGFAEAKVDTPTVSTRPNGTLTVNFPITEGVQTILTDVHVEGNEQVATKDLPKLQLRSGDPLNPQLERVDQVALQTYYADRGNAEVQITPRLDLTPDHSKAKLAWIIAEGPKEKIGQVIVRGNTYTESSVVLRKSDLKTGEPFSYTSLLEAQRNLYRLGIFQRVDIEPEQAGTASAERNVVISVEEGKDVTLSGSLGLTEGITAPDNSIRPLESLSIAQRNLFGTGRYLGIELVHVPRERKDVFLTWIEPSIGSHDVPVQFTIFQNDDIRRGAHIRERGAYIDASKVARFQTRWSVRYQYKVADCIVQAPGDICDLAASALLPGVDRSIGNIRISSLTPTFFWDKRDDPVDPHRGFLTSTSVEEAFRAFNAEADFTKEFTQAAWYYPVTDRSVFAVGARLGLIQPRGGTPVPLSERFTAGGDSSHRAFALDLLGTLCQDPRDFHDGRCEPTLIHTGTNGTIVAPIGGNGLVLLNTEYRYPIFSAVGGQIFFDAGNVYAGSAIRINDLRYGIGTGLRYLSPVGPIRFDVGYKLSRRITGFDSEGKAVFEKPFAYFITLGYAF